MYMLITKGQQRTLGVPMIAEIHHDQLQVFLLTLLRIQE